MCNLYRMTKNADEVALWFDAVEAAQGANFAGEVYPGYPGVVIAERAVRSMNWGFPLQMKGKSGQPLKPRPVNNTRADKLDSFFWRCSFEERRCLIPISAWAEAEGAQGRKTRTWFSRPDGELSAVAGIWRSSEEWGDVYSMVMTDSAGVAAQCHDRMPVLLAKQDWSRWTDGSTEDAHDLCVSWTGALEMDRTAEPWAKSA